MADHAFLAPGSLSLLSSWHGALCYSLQLYFDFSGYSEMALGLALLFNIRFPANFDSPYKSKSVIEYWQRWHMTLTRYINLYIYNPIALRVTRKRAAQGKSISKAAHRSFAGFTSMVAYPTFVTLLLAGIWHGFGLHYIIFGLLHAVYLSVNHVSRLWRRVPTETADRWYRAAGKVLLTYLAVLVAQIFFRATSTESAFALLKGMAGLNDTSLIGDWREVFAMENGFSVMHELGSLYSASMWAVILLFVWVWSMPNVLQVFSRFEPSLTRPRTPWQSPWRWQPDWEWAVALGIVGALAFLGVGGASVFLYFQF